MFVTGFVKPIIVEQTPKQIESEASGDDILENCFSGELDSDILGGSLHDEALNLLESYTVGPYNILEKHRNSISEEFHPKVLYLLNENNW